MNWRLTSLLTFVGCLVNLDTDPSVGVWVWWSLAAAMSLKREAGAVRASRWLAKNPILQENARIFRISISILCKSRWWFQIFLIFTPIWGNNPILTNIFQMGWFNHQPDMFFFLSGKMSFWTDLWNLQWFIGSPKPPDFLIPKGDLNRPWKSTKSNPVIFCRCDSNFSFVWKYMFTPFYPGRIRVHMDFFSPGHWFLMFFFPLKRFQLMVNCLFRLVVWIPGSPYEKGIVTKVYPDSNPKPLGPKPAIYINLPLAEATCVTRSCTKIWKN